MPAPTLDRLTAVFHEVFEDDSLVLSRATSAAGGEAVANSRLSSGHGKGAGWDMDGRSPHVAPPS